MTLRVPPFKVTQDHRTSTDRPATYDFRSTFHSNHGPISYRFRDKWGFQSRLKNRNLLCFLSAVWPKVVIFYYTYSDVLWVRSERTTVDKGGNVMWNECGFSFLISWQYRAVSCGCHDSARAVLLCCAWRTRNRLYA